MKLPLLLTAFSHAIWFFLVALSLFFLLMLALFGLAIAVEHGLGDSAVPAAFWLVAILTLGSISVTQGLRKARHEAIRNTSH
jgi:hypothetical protein